MSKNKAKYTFVEFVAAIESDDFDNIDQGWLPWSRKLIRDIPDILNAQKHYGDCTNFPVTCTLCLIEGLLRDYREYTFNPEQWKKDNGF